MTVFLILFLFIAEIVRYLELRYLIGVIQKETSESPPKLPPTARKSFVVKRMEEKLKEAMYPVDK